MAIVSSLKLVQAARPQHQPAIVKQRNKLIAGLYDQIQLATAQQQGTNYVKIRQRRVKNSVTGEYADVSIHRSPRAWYWTADTGKVMLCLRYGVRTLELAKGKTSIEVGDFKHLIPTLELVKQAVAAGELDAQIQTASTEVARKFTIKSK
jgi:hypothetical protein